VLGTPSARGAPIIHRKHPPGYQADHRGTWAAAPQDRHALETLEMVKQEVNRTKEYILKMMPGGRQMKCLDLLVVIDNDLAIGDIRLER
jgi:hypothetical protein